MVSGLSSLTHSGTVDVAAARVTWGTQLCRVQRRAVELVVQRAIFTCPGARAAWCPGIPRAPPSPGRRGRRLPAVDLPGPAASGEAPASADVDVVVVACCNRLPHRRRPRSAGACVCSRWGRGGPGRRWPAGGVVGCRRRGEALASIPVSGAAVTNSATMPPQSHEHARARTATPTRSADCALHYLSTSRRTAFARTDSARAGGVNFALHGDNWHHGCNRHRVAAVSAVATPVAPRAIGVAGVLWRCATATTVAVDQPCRRSLRQSAASTSSAELTCRPGPGSTANQLTTPSSMMAAKRWMREPRPNPLPSMRARAPRPALRCRRPA